MRKYSINISILGIIIFVLIYLFGYKNKIIQCETEESPSSLVCFESSNFNKVFNKEEICTITTIQINEKSNDCIESLKKSKAKINSCKIVSECVL